MDKKKIRSDYDTLLYMKSRLGGMPEISPQELNLIKIPDSDEYQFIHDLHLIYPKKPGIHATDPQSIHHLIAKLKSEYFFEKEIRGELENTEKYHTTKKAIKSYLRKSGIKK